MTITVGPAQSLRAAVPGDQAHHLITTFGILGSVCGGIGGAALTLRNQSLAGLALAELALALAAAVLIAVCGLTRARQDERARRDELARQDVLARPDVLARQDVLARPVALAQETERSPREPRRRGAVR
jgi:hypothetical protein